MMSLNHRPKDTWQAEERYCTLVPYLQKNISPFDIKKAQNLLSGKKGFICQYDRKAGKETVWSVIHQTPNRSIFRVEQNPARTIFNLLKKNVFLF